MGLMWRFNPFSQDTLMPTDFVQVDAFTHRPFYGNSAAVVFDAPRRLLDAVRLVLSDKLVCKKLSAH